MKNEELQCTYRSAINVVSLMIAIAFSVGTLWAAIELKDIRIGVVTVVAFLCAMYLGLRIANQRVVLAQDKIIIYSLWNKKTEYDIKDITKIAVANQSRTKYIKIYLGDKSLLVRKDIKKYDDFVKKLCDRLQIKGYTRGGVSEYTVK